ncbi:hypothetical protein [Sphingorhabdus sp. SMR4y]|uniref:hypothetical protein n=1 Tax=Sphingorhabdus sp. SMR4y TaxID=2584094 RepID=UPI000B611330|nr:hypothetical protein [Sphingorhabdus sp. SMR4y]ASK88354.1 hypothetical protein SPHFLASMR4Y_01606 [Sphingorhabdus sp. SMR4y]
MLAVLLIRDRFKGPPYAISTDLLDEIDIGLFNGRPDQRRQYCRGLGTVAILTRQSP